MILKVDQIKIYIYLLQYFKKKYILRKYVQKYKQELNYNKKQNNLEHRISIFI
jgi:hypothetical protein